MGIGRIGAIGGSGALALGAAALALSFGPGGPAAGATGRATSQVVHLGVRGTTSPVPAAMRRGPDLEVPWSRPKESAASRESRTSTASAAQQTLNWAGEVATGSSFSGVSGDWTVPSVAGSAGTSDSATWIGIGGASKSSTGLIQTGTDQHVSTGVTSYSAWYEILPSTSTTVVNPTTGQPYPVAPGDHMQAEILRQPSGSWLIQIHDATQGWTARGTFGYSGTTRTAEWIEEAPTVRTRIETLADFGSVRFTHMKGDAASATTLVATEMVAQSGIVIAYPGSVKPTTTQSVTVYYGSPSTPQGLTPAGTTPPGSTAATTPPVTPPATAPATTAPSTPAPSTPASGYDLVGANGSVYVFDPRGTQGGFYGSLPGIHVSPKAPIVGMVVTSNDKGYYLVGADGGVFAFGDAPYLGSLPGSGISPSQPIVGIVAANTGHGYFLVGRDGGVFSFGAVPFVGSLPAEGIKVDDIVGIAATPSGNGYWVIASTGRVYAFGAARHFGTVPSPSSPITSITATATGGGYWATTTKGAVYAFGDARKYGTLLSSHVASALPVVGLVRATQTGGYWLVDGGGAVHAFGDAPFIGALPGSAHVRDITGAVATTPAAA